MVGYFRSEIYLSFSIQFLLHLGYVGLRIVVWGEMNKKTQIKTSPAGPDYSFETAALAEYGGLVAGVDEAGRGPWAGPVVAGAVILNPGAIPVGLNDSKKLSEQKREGLFELIMAQAQVGVGIADVERIDRDNILQASLWAMTQAVAQLAEAPNVVLVDGNKLPQLPMAGQAIVKGDGRSLSIAAGSIIAKVTRDRMMCALGEEYPQYHWHSNKGYGTKAHQQGLSEFGVCSHHRKSFKPIRKLIDLIE